jgi:uncharacterized protein (TIGR00251 family)
MIRETAEGVEISVRVIPRAQKTGLSGTRDGVPLVRLAAPPVDDAANECLVAFMARLFECPRRNIRIVAGERGRLKRLAIAAITVAAARRRLEG